MDWKKLLTSRVFGFVLFLVIVGVLFALSGPPVPHTKDLTLDYGGTTYLIQLVDEDGYDIKPGDPCRIYQNDRLLCDAAFLDMSYEAYDRGVKNLAKDVQNMRIIESSQREGLGFTLWRSEDGSFNIGCQVSGSGKVFTLWCTESEKDIQECFDRLTVTVP